MSDEKRWIVLSEDGRHVTIGRHTDPPEDEIQAAGSALKANGHGGWLAVTEGVYYSPSPKLGLLMVREIAPASSSWENAVAAFMRIRRDVIAATGARLDEPAGPG